MAVRQPRTLRWATLAALAAALGSARCGLDGGATKHRCVTTSDCSSPHVCVAGICRDPSSDAVGGGAGEGDSSEGGASLSAGKGGRPGVVFVGGSGPDGGLPGQSGIGGSVAASGGAGVGGGDGGAGAGGGAGGDAGDAGSKGQAGTSALDCPEMVALPGGFCIDSLEVSRADYTSWLDSGPTNPMNPGCESNPTFEPACDWAAGLEKYPANCVDWCDAYAYCAAHGKRLCGDVRGGAASYSSYDRARENEWYAACTSGGVRAYPYGDSFEQGSCGDLSIGELREGGSFPECQADGEYACVFDLSGNVWEWEDACEADHFDSNCRLRGGSFKQTDGYIYCAYAGSAPRLGGGDNVGFRCCADDC